MKFLVPPLIDDLAELDGYSMNENVTTHGILNVHLGEIKLQYQNYLQFSGNPWNINSCNLPHNLQTAMKLHYSTQPGGAFTFIKDYRDNLSPDFCPMCGSLKTGQLDHYLPKADFAEFSVFSKNLVPACDCNQKRGQSVKAAVAPGRAIHPYFDGFLGDRLFKAVFVGEFHSPEISVQIINPQHPNIEILEFHLKEVILKNNIIGFLEKKWSNLLVNPTGVLRNVLPIGQLDDISLGRAIVRHIDGLDDDVGTPNSWPSIFYFGVSEDKNILIRLSALINSL
jgi:hypothetical protein